MLGENGFAGAALATLPDGRVVLSGGPQPVITLFDPATHAVRRVGADRVARVPQRRSRSAPTRCSSPAAVAMSRRARAAAWSRNSSRRYDAEALGTIAPGADAARSRAIGALDLRRRAQRDGERTFVLAGGVAPTGGGSVGRGSAHARDRRRRRDRHVRAARALDGGAVLTAFAPDGDDRGRQRRRDRAGRHHRAADRARARARRRAAGRLEDGRVLGVGGDPMATDRSLRSDERSVGARDARARDRPGAARRARRWCGSPTAACSCSAAARRRRRRGSTGRRCRARVGLGHRGARGQHRDGADRAGSGDRDARAPDWALAATDGARARARRRPAHGVGLGAGDGARPGRWASR